jgi:hypothetical protein
MVNAVRSSPNKEREKKALEAGYLDALRRAVPDFPAGEAMDQKEPRTPDFIFSAPAGAIGIEVTRLYQSSAGPQPEAYQKLICDRAREIAIELGLPSLHVSVLFSLNVAPTKRDLKKLPDQLANAIGRKIPTGEDAVRLTWEDGLALPIDAVSAKRALERDATWEPAGLGEIAHNFADRLQERVDNKEREISRYLQNCSACWLLIVADWTGPSAFFEMSEDTASHVYECSFERVYFLDHFLQKVYRLRTSLSEKLHRTAQSI